MFLYLSKLLPLFFYPLGLACILLVVALVTLWKRPRWAAVAVSLALIYLLVGGNSWTAFYLARSLEWQNLPAAELPNAEAIVVLGGATYPDVPPSPTVELNEAGDRLLYAAHLYQQKKAPLIVPSGGRIDWQGFSSAESTAMATILKQIGVPSEAIIEEPFSRNTYENAVNVKKILTERGIRQVLLVTSAMHMPRSLLIFKRQGIAAIAAPTDFLVSNYELQELGNSTQSKLLYLLPDADKLELFTRGLKEYIGLVVYRLHGWL